jgi:hypothetical protein
MKWMLVVLVFGVTPMETGLSYNSLDYCLKAEERMRADWDHILKASKKQYSEMKGARFPIYLRVWKRRKAPPIAGSRAEFGAS